MPDLVENPNDLKTVIRRYEADKTRRAGEPSIGNDRPDAADDWFTLSKKFFNRVGPLMKQSAAGIMQGAAEIGAMQPDVPQEARDAIEKMGREGRIPGQSLYRIASEDLAENAYNTGDSNLKYYGTMLADSMVQMVPAIAATLTTQSPAAGMSVMGAQVWGQQYGESRADGRTASQSFGDASFNAAAEVIGEQIPLGMMMKPGGTFLKRTLKQMGAEGLQETFTQILQTGYDMGVLHPDMTWGEAVKQVRDAAIVGTAMGGGMSIAGTAFNKATGRAEDVAPPKAPPSNLTPDDIASPLPNDLLSTGKSEMDAALAAAAAPAGANLDTPAIDIAVQPKRERERPKAAGLDRIIQITIQTESGGNRNAVSPKGAKSEMQVMDATNLDPGYGVKPAQNGSLEERARVGRDYVAAMLRKYGGDPAKAWAAYNMGPGGFDAVIKEYGEDWLNHVPAETRGYVLKNLNRLGGEGFDAEGSVRPVDVPAQDEIDIESASDFVKRVLGEDFFNTDSAAPTAPTDTPAPEGNIAGEPINKEWSAFSPDSGSLGIPRDQMPQIAAEVRGALVNFLNARGIKSEQVDIPATLLKPTQAEFSPSKVRKAIDYSGGDRSILVSNDGYVLDGHHQWMARREQGQPIKAQVLDASIQDLLNVVPEFPSATTAGGSRPGPTAAPTTNVGPGSIDMGSAPAAQKSKIHPRANDLDADLLTFIAANGGINDNGSHGLRSKRNLQTFIPGIGPLIRPTGMDIDKARERLAEVGWISDNATEADVLNMIERAKMKEDVFHPGSNRTAPKGQEPEGEARARIGSYVSQLGLETFGEPEMGYALGFVAEGYPEERAIWAAMERAILEEFAINGAPTTEKANGQEAQWTEVADPFPESGGSDGAIAADSQRSDAATGQAGSGSSEDSRPATTDQGSVTFEDTPSGKGVIVKGLSEEQKAAIAKAVPKASGAPNRDGGVTYSKKHEAAIREAIAADKASSVTVGDKLAGGMPVEEAAAVARKANDAIEAKLEPRGNQDDSQNGEVSKPEATPTRPNGYGSKNKIVNDDRAAQARERIKAAMNRANSGIDPELLAEGVILATYHIEAGARKFADFAKAVSEDLGKSLSELRPYLRAWYQGAQAMLEDGGEDVSDMDGPGAVRAAMTMIEDQAASRNPDAPIINQPTEAGRAAFERGDPRIVPSEFDLSTSVGKAKAEAWYRGYDKANLDSPVKNPREGTTPDSPLRGRIEGTFRTAFENGQKFESITAARDYVRSTIGETIKPGTAEAKIMDEAIESAVIYTARQIAVRNESSPQQAYQKLVDLYNAQPKLGVRSSTSIEQQAYSTPVPLAYLASRLAGINQNTTVYEPTAGNGALLIDARPTYVTANELNPDRVAQLRKFLPGAKITENDALANAVDQVDVVIANPPFGPLRGEDGQTVRFQVDEQYSTNEIDHAIAMKALGAMKDSGSAVLIVGGINKLIVDPKKRSDAYNGKAKREFYFRLYSQYNVVDHFTVDGALYERQGAGWPVDVIVVKGRGKSNMSLPAVRVPRQYGSWDAIAEVLNDGRTQNARPTGAESRGNPAQERGPAIPDVGASGVSGERRNDRRAGLSENQQPRDVRSGSTDGQSGREGVGEQRRAVDQAANDQRGSGATGRDQARIAPEVAENDKQVTYHPGSGGNAMGTLVPVNMQTALSDALDNLAYRVGGDIDAFVSDRLGYDQADLYSRFGAEQIDAIALAIDNIERGAGFIIGDQTGIGKGRVVAAIIRYAIKQGRAPIFVTEKPTLYADMYRDMTDIGMQEMLGRDVNIAITNSSQNIPLNEDGTKVLKSPATAKHTEMLNRLAANGLKSEGVDALFTTYSQMQTLKGSETERQRAIRAIASGGVLILDESHNAGGSGVGMIKKKGAGPNRAEFVRELVGLAHGVFYSSATYAKRPDVMDLYAATDMRLAVDDMDKLAEAISKGGVPMQQVVAAMLSRAGQYVRRERSFDGIAYNTPVAEVDRETYGQASTILKAIQDFSETYVKDATEAVKEEVKAEAESVSYDGSLGAAGARSTNFTAIMHNVINQMLLAFKAEEAATRAIAAIERGEKPVITASNTLETLLEEYAEDNDIKIGQEMDISFADVFRRYLERSRWITIKKPFSAEKGKQVRLTDAQLGADGAVAFREAMKIIDESKLDQLPGSPIDYVLSKIEAAGYKTAEITGRTHGLNYRDGTAYLKARSMGDRSIKGKIAAIRGFNDGAIDAIFLNRSGSTGLSLHASEKFKDKRKRRMILAQAEGNIDTHMQMLGRVHRTGQVVLPEYDQLVAGIPAEKRPAAVLAKKMASLNANTTASRDSALTSKEVIDFMNEYGDEVVARIMGDEPEMHSLLGDPLVDEEEGYDKKDAARRVTGRIPLLPVDMQDELYQRIEDEYRALLEQKDAAGENALEAKTFDLKAETLSSNEAAPRVHGSTSPFADGVNVERVSVVRLGKPYPLSEVVARVAASLGRNQGEGTAADLARVMSESQQAERDALMQVVRDAASFANEAISKIKNGESAQKQREHFDQSRARFQAIRRAYSIGSTVRLSTENGNIYGVITEVEKAGKSKNPVALGSWRMGVALVDASRHISIPFSQILLPNENASDTAFGKIKVEHAKSLGLFDIVDAFDNMQTESREERSIVTGNLLSGFDYVNGKGTIINYTTADGEVKQGIMLSRGFNFEKHHASRPIALTTPEVIVEWLKESGGEITGQGAKGKIAVLAIPARDTFVLTAPKSKSDGGEFFLNKRLTAAMGGEFVSKSNGMVASSSMSRAPDAIGVLLQSGVKFEIPAGASDEVKTAARALVEKYAPRETRKVEEAQPVSLAPETAQPERAMTQAQRGELEARQQQSMARRGGQESIKDQAGGLFSAERDQDDMFGRREYRGGLLDPATERTLARRKDLWKSLNKRLQALGLGDKVTLRVVDRLASGAFGDAGFHDGQSLIRIALTGYEEFVLDHEVVHILLDLGLLRNAEWTALAKAAQANSRIMNRVKKAYPDLSDDALVEEAVADMVAEWRQGRLASSGLARVAMQRILSFFDALRNIFRRDGALKAEAEAVMRRIDSGEIGSRESDPADVSDGTIRESRAATIIGDGRWDGIRERLDVWRTNMQDRMLPLLRTQQRIELQSGKSLAEGMNPYLAEELMSGKVGAKLEHLADEMVGPMFEQIKAEGLTVDEVEMYLYARHAPERNARISEINPEFGEGTGSGMTDAEAQSIMERVDIEGKREALERVAAKVDNILAFAIDTRVEAGLLSEEEADSWREQYQSYVPLRGRAELAPESGEAVRPSYGSGINVRGAESKRAFGRESRASDILAYSIMQAEEAVIRAGRNEVAQAFYRMVKANPDPSMWTIQQVRRKPTWNKALGQVVYRNDSNISPEDEPYTVSLKIDGSERRVTLYRDNPAAVRLAKAMRNLEGNDFGAVTQFLSSVNRYLSFVNTGLNPEFVITNAFRDIQTASVNLAQFDLKGLEAGSLKDYPAALKASVAGAFKKGEGDWGKWYQEFLDEGGRVYFNQVEDLNDIRKKIERTFTAQSGTLGATRTGLMHVKEFIENANNGVENAIRLSAYKNARERGMSKAQAASLAKNLTVNFNRRGAWGPVMNSLYLFYNASIQGSARIAQAAFSKGAGGRRVRRILGGMIVGGVMLDILNMMLSGDDDDGESYYDKISEFDKSRNLIVMIPGSKGEFFKIPLPYGYNAFFSVGRAASEIVRGKNTLSVGGNLFATIADAFNPVGGSENILKIVSPTITDPVVEIVTNEDFAGRPIAPQDYPNAPETPDSQKYWGSVQPHWRIMTDLLNSMTGGDEVVPGRIDISPETLEHLSGVAIGAAGAFFERSVGLVEKTIAGDEIDANYLPLVRKVVGSKPSWYDKAAYYARKDEVEQAMHNLKEYAERGDAEKYERYAIDNDQILSLDDVRRSADSDMRALKKARGELEMASGQGEITAEEYRAQKREIDDQQKAVIANFNRIYLETVDNPMKP